MPEPTPEGCYELEARSEEALNIAPINTDARVEGDALLRDILTREFPPVPVRPNRPKIEEVRAKIKLVLKAESREDIQERFRTAYEEFIRFLLLKSWATRGDEGWDLLEHLNDMAVIAAITNELANIVYYSYPHLYDDLLPDIRGAEVYSTHLEKVLSLLIVMNKILKDMEKQKQSSKS